MAGTPNADGTTTVVNADGSTSILYPNGTIYNTSVQNPDGSVSTTYYFGNPTPYGPPTTVYPDGSSVTGNPDGTTSYSDGQGHNTVTDANGSVLTPQQINDLNNKNNGPIGAGGLLGMGSNPLTGAFDAFKAAARQAAHEVVPPVPNLPPLDTAGANATQAGTQSIVDYLAAAAKNVTPGVAPTVNAVQTGPQTLAQALQAAPVSSATAAQIGAIPQVVAPTIGPAPTAQAFGATGYAATGSAAQGFGATAGQAVAAQLDPTQQAENRAYQENLIQSLQGTIAGNTPSVADLQLRATEQRQAANQLGIAAAASGGGNSPLALRTAANNIGRLNQASSADAALLRAQEIATAQNQLGGVADQARTGDISLAGQNASLKTGVSQTNAQQQTAASVATAGNLTDASKATASNLTAANIASAGNLTDASKATAANQTSTSQANANNLTQLLAKQAELQYQASHDNAGNQLSTDQTNANLATNVSLANALAQNTKALQDAKLATDVSQTNANNATTLSINNAGFLNDANKTNATNFLNQEQLNEKTQNDANSSWINANGQLVTGQGNILSAQAQNNATNAGIDKANQQATIDTLKAGGQGVAWLASDRRAKTDVSDGRADAQALLDALSSKSFRYKDPGIPGARPGRQTGVMAQDVERAPAGKPMVKDTPTGKKLDPSAGFGTVLSMLAQLNDRLNKTEGRRAT
jgi:hypothetical protein